MPVAPGPIATFAVTPTLSLVLGVKPEMQQRVVVVAGYQHNVAATPAITAARSAVRHVLFAAKRKTAVAAIAGLHADNHFINKHVVQNKRGRPEKRAASVRE